MVRFGMILVLLAAGGTRADIVSHAVVRYGDVSLTTDEHFGTATASANLLYTSPGLFHGAAEATASYGSVTATATVLGIGAAYPINIAQAEGAYSDSLTISGPSGLGFVIYTYTVRGWSAGDLSLGALFLRHGSDPDEELGDAIAGDGEYASLPHAITFGQAFTHGIVLQANGVLSLGETGEFGCDLSATMSGLEVFDAAMRPVGEFTVGSVSGTQYPLPTPGGLPVLAIALACSRPRRAGVSSL